MKKILLYSLLIILFSSGAQFSFAQTPATPPPCKAGPNEYCLLEPLPCVEGTLSNCAGATTVPKVNINDYISYVFKLSIALAVLLATVVIIYSGFEWMISESSVVTIAKAKSQIWNASMGLIGALAAYLILQTIDPRLVNISTTIPAICPPGYETKAGSICNPTESLQFQKDLQNNLTRLTVEKRIDVLDLENKRLAIEKEKLDLDGKLARGEITADEHLKGTTDIASRKTDIVAAQTRAIAEGTGLSDFNLANKLIYTEGNIDTNALSQYTAGTVKNELQGGKYPVNSPNRIQNDFNQRINDIRAMTTQTESSEEAISNLESQRDFYIAQVNEDYNLQTKINGDILTTNRTTGSVSKSVDYPYLRTKLNEYKADLADPKKLAASGIPAGQYTSMIQTRIDSINKALGPTPR